MTRSNPLGKAVAVFAAAALIVIVLPAEQVVAEEIAPETKSAEIDDIAVESREVIDDRSLEDSNEDEAELGAESATDDPELDGSDAEEAPATGQGDEEADDSPPTTIREVSKIIETPIPFTGLGFSGDGDDAPEILWRALGEGGEWSSWNLVEALDEFEGPDPGSLEGRAASDGPQRWVSDAIWVGPATHLQVQVDGGELSDLNITVIDSAGLSESLVAKVKRTLGSLGTPSTAEASDSQPNIRRRSDWGADEGCTKGTINYATPKAAVVHHTVTKSDYTRDEVPQQIRNMYHWHTSCQGISGNGWNDIGYNFVIDRFGGIWEGRRGGIDKGVIGAHAGGWNTGTFGVAFMGNHNLVVPSQASLDAAAELVSWKFDLHGIDSGTSATTTLNSQRVPTLVGHNNVRGSYTVNPSVLDCPGQYLYFRLSQIRDAVSAGGNPWTPVVGDWNGNGQTTIGWFRDGEWRLRNSNSAGSASLSFEFGRAGDLPVVGDWNADGRSTIGIVRGSEWLLRNSNRGGSPDTSFHYGRGAIDFPMAGDWNGNGRDTPAIVRDGEWHLRNSLSGGPGQIVFTYGRITQGDIPVVGDWTGDRQDTPGILRRGEWHLRNSHAGGPADFTFIYGRLQQGDTPIVGDWNANGSTTIGITRGGDWHLRNHLSGGPANITFTYR